MVTPKLCCSWLNVFNKEKRCNRIANNGTDFCRYHIRHKIYMSDNLKPLPIANMPIENLLGIYDSWDEVPIKYRILMDNSMWDLRIMANIFANQINSCEMEAPKPLYPHNPFNRKNFSIQDLILFRSKCKETNLNIYVGLDIFLENINNIHCDQEYMTSKNTCHEIIATLSNTLRFQIKNNKNSQDCYTGIWISKKIKKSDFEKAYIKYNSEPFQLYDEDTGIIVTNPEKIFMKLILNTYPQEQYDMNDPLYCT